MKRKIKKIINKLPNIICVLALSTFIFMANGYGILKQELTINGKAEINEEIIKPEVKFKRTQQIGDYIFFYDIIIYNNNTNINYQNWQIKIKDTEYISYPYSIDGKRTDDGWILTNYNWDDRIEAGEKVNVTITFEVSSEIPNTILVEEYVEDFLNNSIEITCTNSGADKEGTLVQNGKAKLILKGSEIEIKDFKVKVDSEYVAQNPNEKMYVITINNNTDSDFLIIRGNIYVGSNRILEVSPSVVTCDHIDNATFTLPHWVQLSKGSSLMLYIMIRTTEENFIPDIVLSATI